VDSTWHRRTQGRPSFHPCSRAALLFPRNTSQMHCAPMRNHKNALAWLLARNFLTCFLPIRPRSHWCQSVSWTCRGGTDTYCRREHLCALFPETSFRPSSTASGCDCSSCHLKIKKFKFNFKKTNNFCAYLEFFCSRFASDRRWSRSRLCLGGRTCRKTPHLSGRPEPGWRRWSPAGPSCSLPAAVVSRGPGLRNFQ